jgi:hypothetical protein
MKKHILTIQFNEFYPENKVHYVETVCKNGIENNIDLKRRPTAARFYEVRECGCGGNGADHLGYCTKVRRLFTHELLKK